MKVYFLLHIAATILLALIFLGCTRKKQPQKHAIGILIDTSEGCDNKDLISAKALKSLCQFEGKAGQVLLTTASDSPIPPISNWESQASSWLDNPHDVEANQRSFVDTIATAIQDLPCTPSKNTYLYASILHLVREMIEAKESTYQLVIASDGQEHEKLVSFARSSQYLKQPEKVIEVLEDTFGALPDLSGFSVEFVYSTKSLPDLQRLEFWSNLLESKGANPTVKSSL